MKMWIARESDGTLLLFRTKPEKWEVPATPRARTKVKYCWIEPFPHDEYGQIELPSSYYKWVTFENSPIRIDFQIIKPDDIQDKDIKAVNDI